MNNRYTKSSIKRIGLEFPNDLIELLLDRLYARKSPSAHQHISDTVEPDDFLRIMHLFGRSEGLEEAKKYNLLHYTPPRLLRLAYELDHDETLLQQALNRPNWYNEQWQRFGAREQLLEVPSEYLHAMMSMSLTAEAPGLDFGWMRDRDKVESFISLATTNKKVERPRKRVRPGVRLSR